MSKDLKDKELLKRLHDSIVNGDINKVKTLVNKLIDVKRKNWYYGVGSPLHSAAGFGKVDILKILLDYGFNIDAYLWRGSEAVTPLVWAVIHNRKSIVEALLTRGADTSILCTWNFNRSCTALGFARSVAKKNKNTEILNLLTKNERLATSAGLCSKDVDDLGSSSVSAEENLQRLSDDDDDDNAESHDEIKTLNELFLRSNVGSLGSNEAEFGQQWIKVIQDQLQEKNIEIMEAEMTEEAIKQHLEDIRKLRQSEYYRTPDEVWLLRQEREKLNEKLANLTNILNGS